MTMTAAGADLEVADVAELLSSGRCSASCLLAAEAKGICTCRCGGVHHGAALRQLTREGELWPVSTVRRGERSAGDPGERGTGSASRRCGGASARTASVADRPHPSSLSHP